MSDFLEMLKTRFAEAQKRLQETQARFQQVQAEMTVAAQEHNSLHVVLNSEMQRAGKPPSSSPPTTQQPMRMIVNRPGFVAAPPAVGGVAQPAPQPPTSDEKSKPSSEVNKTELIRDFIYRNPSGVTPAEIWQGVKVQIPSKTYLYSVLGRLKDREEVSVRRKKYVPKQILKSEEDKGSNIPVQ